MVDSGIGSLNGMRMRYHAEVNVVGVETQWAKEKPLVEHAAHASSGGLGIPGCLIWCKRCLASQCHVVSFDVEQCRSQSVTDCFENRALVMGRRAGNGLD